MFNKTDFPIKQHELIVFANATLGYISVPTTKTRLGIVDGKLGILSGSVDRLNEDWEKNGDPNLHTTIVTSQLNEDIRVVKENITNVLSDIKEESFTIADRETFRMYERAIGTQIQVVDYSPVFRTKAVDFLLLKLVFINSATPTSRAMPNGHWIFFEYYIGEEGLKIGSIPFANAVNISKAFYTLHFKETDLRKTIYMHCYYENEHGQRSPVSTMLTYVIS